MNPIAAFCVSMLLASSVYGGTRVQRSAGKSSGWAAPTTSGWAAPTSGWTAPSSGWGSGTNIAEEGASEAIGAGAAVAEHDAVITVIGDSSNPAVLNIGTGSGVGLNQYASNFQSSQINSDGSSAAYQGNSASNGGYAYEYLGGDASGLEVDVISNGWSAVEGEGAVGQVDALAHQGPGAAASPGWKQP